MTKVFHAITVCWASARFARVLRAPIWRLEDFLAAFEYLDAVVAHAVDTVGHGEGEGVLAALAGIPAKHGGGMGIGVGDKGTAVAQQGEVNVVALAAAIGEEGVVFAGTQVDLLGFGFALGEAAAEMFIQPGAAVFFTHDFTVHALRLRQPVIWCSLGNGRQQHNGQKRNKAGCGHGGGSLLRGITAGYLKWEEGTIENSYGRMVFW